MEHRNRTTCCIIGQDRALSFVSFSGKIVLIDRPTCLPGEGALSSAIPLDTSYKPGQRRPITTQHYCWPDDGVLFVEMRN